MRKGYFRPLRCQPARSVLRWSSCRNDTASPCTWFRYTRSPSLCRGDDINNQHRYFDVISLRPGVKVKKERSALVQGEKRKSQNANGEFTAPQRLQRFRPVATPSVSPYSPSSKAAGSTFSKGEESSSLVSTTIGSCSLRSDHRHRGDNSANRSRRTPRLSREGSGNPVLEGETQRLEALKRRRFMELQQMLAFQLRSLAREVRQSVCVGHLSR